MHPGLIVPRGVAENTLTDELLLTLRAFIWISFHLWEHYGLNMEQSRFCVLELVRYGAVLNRAHLQTRTYLRLSCRSRCVLVRNDCCCTHKTHSVSEIGSFDENGVVLSCRWINVARRMCLCPECGKSMNRNPVR